MGLQTLENKVLSWGIIVKSAPILAEITIWKSQVKAGGVTLYTEVLNRAVRLMMPTMS
jgi:hypothetical protein